MEWVYFATILLAFAELATAATWAYDGEKGPEFWHELFPQACSGKYQSPIDIRPEETMYNPALKDFAMWYDPPRPDCKMRVSNNGHSVQVTTEGELYVTNGGLPNVYKTVQFHFHWGNAKHHGSEHLIDGHAYPLELHIVNYNHDLYKTIGEAATEKQGLAVLGVMFEMSDEDNEDMEPLIAAMEQVSDPEEGREVEIEPMSLRSLLPEDMTRYYRYNGSLTTPGCFESVVWTVFHEPRTLSSRQMKAFRETLQFRHRHGGRHKRSVDDVLPVAREARRREKRALEVLTELGINTHEERARFRREVQNQKANAVKLNEDNAGRTHHDTLGHVHKQPAHDDEDNEHTVTELEVEYIQEKLVNNYRPVQPLNGRLVYRSFKLSETSGRQHEGGHGSEHHGSQGKHGGTYRRPDKDDPNEMQERLKYYESVGAGSSSTVVSLLLMTCSLLALFL